jgi:glutamine synthetase
MSGNLTFEQLKKAVADGSIDTVVVAFVDMQGRLIGKRCPCAATSSRCALRRDPRLRLPARRRHRHGAGAGLRGGELGEGLWRLRDEARHGDALPHAVAPGTALVLADVNDHHGDDRCPYSPRGMLKKPGGKARRARHDGGAASELEFYMFDEDYEAIRRRSATRSSRPPGYYIQDYARPADHPEET